MKTLILSIQKGGLGDHLFYSHLPRIAKQYGGFNQVFFLTILFLETRILKN